MISDLVCFMVGRAFRVVFLCFLQYVSWAVRDTAGRTTVVRDFVYHFDCRPFILQSSNNTRIHSIILDLDTRLIGRYSVNILVNFFDVRHHRRLVYPQDSPSVILLYTIIV